MDKQKNAPKPTLYIVNPEVSNGPPMQDYFIWRKKKEKPQTGGNSEFFQEKEMRESSPENRMDGSVNATMETEALGGPGLSKEVEPISDSYAEVTEPISGNHADVTKTVAESLAIETEAFVEVDIFSKTPTDSHAASLDDLEDLAEAAEGSTPIEANAGEVQHEPIAKKEEQPMNQRNAAKQSALVQHFMQQLKEKIIPPANPNGSTFGELEDSSKEHADLPEPNENTEKIWRMVTTLARYPKFLDPPLVTAVVNGVPLTFQIDSKRGDKLRIKIENEMKIIKIKDISEIKIL
ncbi:hypothetical protein [Bacillus sp. FJAT-27245]|uniref:hypothetical protein n=1 Tax=Bacillus sp. FJAT-27245 TaxID=1684144 RepID=UPI0006A7D8CB|nr:hypothetical protein [Bacillus sp. FJAT-27245]